MNMNDDMSFDTSAAVSSRINSRMTRNAARVERQLNDEVIG
jgi:hypothetical protein